MRHFTSPWQFQGERLLEQRNSANILKFGSFGTPPINDMGHNDEVTRIAQGDVVNLTDTRFYTFNFKIFYFCHKAAYTVVNQLLLKNIAYSNKGNNKRGKHGFKRSRVVNARSLLYNAPEQSWVCSFLSLVPAFPVKKICRDYEKYCKGKVLDEHLKSLYHLDILSKQYNMEISKSNKNMAFNEKQPVRSKIVLKISR